MPIFRITLAIAFLIAYSKELQPDISIFGFFFSLTCLAVFSLNYRNKK